VTADRVAIRVVDYRDAWGKARARGGGHVFHDIIATASSAAHRHDPAIV